MAHILVVDDEAGIREVLADVLGDEGHEVIVAGDGLTALAMIERRTIDCVLLDVWLPGKGGMDVLDEIRDRRPLVPVIVISGHATIELAVRAVQAGAFDVLEKPLSFDKVTTVVRNAVEVESLRVENRRLRTEATTLPRLVGSSAAMERVRVLIAQAAAGDARVLITGSNGTGKELAARHLHAAGARRSGPFVAVNCAAIPEQLIESELFGHEKGAFTGADSDRIGRVELAHGGTLFLDEVADMSLAAQAKMLRVMQELQFERLGGERTISIDVRVLAATNKNLTAEIAAGRFREDLFFRLNVVPLRMPALVERLDDIPELVAALAKELGTKRVFAPDAIERLRQHDWPGNVRELRNVVERLTILAGSDTVTVTDVDRFAAVATRSIDATAPEGLAPYQDMSLAAARDTFERALIEYKLKQTGYNVSRAAQAFQVYPSSLHARIKKLGIGARS